MQLYGIEWHRFNASGQQTSAFGSIHGASASWRQASAGSSKTIAKPTFSLRRKFSYQQEDPRYHPHSPPRSGNATSTAETGIKGSDSVFAKSESKRYNPWGSTLCTILHCWSQIQKGQNHMELAKMTQKCNLKALKKMRRAISNL